MSRPRNENQIDYIELPASQIEATKQFYGTVFGCTFEHYGPDYTSFFDGRPAVDSKKHAPEPSQGLLLVIYARDLNGAQQKIKAAGGSIVKDTFSFPGGRRFHFADPNGNQLAVWSDVAE